MDFYFKNLALTRGNRVFLLLALGLCSVTGNAALPSDSMDSMLSVQADKATQQSRFRVSGVVKDQQGEPLIGVNVQNKRTLDGTITDMDGNFNLQVETGDVLEFSYVGYTTQQVKITNNRSLTVTMSEDQELLDEVVVTALGIKKEAKALSYNVQQMNATELTAVKDANFMNALAGKVAGVNINTSSSGIGGGTKVVMRGTKSISGNNNALYVIDGIPMPQLSTAQPSDLFTGMGQSGDGASMVNPEDIESMSVLSSAAASALYGSDAANGVIMITTKRGSKDRTSVSYANNTSFFNPFVLPEFQNTYGMSEPGSYYSWGNKLSNPSAWSPKEFFQTGYNVGNSVTLSTGSEKSQTFVSVASTNAEGIVENNTLDRYNFSIRNTTDMLNGKLHLDLSAMFMNVKEKNMVAQGQYFNPLVEIYLFPVGEDIKKFQTYEHYNQERNFKTQYWPYGNQGMAMQNPYWIINRDLFENNKNRFLLSGGMTYDLAKGINVSGRAKMDYTSAMFEKKYYASTDPIFADVYGAYFKDDNTVRQMYGDLMLNIDKYFGDFSVTSSLGASIKDVNYQYSNVGGNLNSVANAFTFNNVTPSTSTLSQNRYHEQTQSVFATAQVGWKSGLYLDLTGRVDWSSALAYTDISNVAYGSAGVSAVFTDLFPSLKNDVLSFLKVRASYAEVGNAPTRFVAFQTYPFLSASPTTEATYPNTDIKPERTASTELGLQANLFNNKINLNVSVYNTQTKNQLFNPALSTTSGYSSIYINSGRVDNKGLEASITLNQKLGQVDWSSTLVYTINRNKIKQLLREITLANGTVIPAQTEMDMDGVGNVKVKLTEGGSMGDLYVNTLKTDFHGYIDVDYTQKTVTADSKNYVYAGNVNAKYTLGWRNSFNWKGLNLGFLVSARVGGVVASMTQALMDAYGTSKASADARDAGGALVNGYRIPAENYYRTVGAGVGAMYVYSATNVRLAELTLGYDIPVTKVLPWVKGLNVAFTGRNLLMLYKKAPFDPELTASTGTYFQGIDYFMMPSLRNLGFAVKVNF